MYILKVDASNKDTLRGLFWLTFYVVLDYDIPENGDRDSRKTGKLGPTTLAGPSKNWKSWTQDPSGTLEKPENQDPGP